MSSLVVSESNMPVKMDAINVLSGNFPSFWRFLLQLSRVLGSLLHHENDVRGERAFGVLRDGVEFDVRLPVGFESTQIMSLDCGQCVGSRLVFKELLQVVVGFGHIPLQRVRGESCTFKVGLGYIHCQLFIDPAQLLE